LDPDRSWYPFGFFGLWLRCYRLFAVGLVDLPA
jgi:hypothetical protein